MSKSYVKSFVKRKKEKKNVSHILLHHFRFNSFRIAFCNMIGQHEGSTGKFLVENFKFVGKVLEI